MSKNTGPMSTIQVLHEVYLKDLHSLARWFRFVFPGFIIIAHFFELYMEGGMEILPL